MSRVRVSIALASCDGEAYIAAQLASFAAQTRPPDELVVCDDASSDATCRHVEAFSENAPFPVRIVRNPERLGITGNFERAVSHCEGEIVFLADQDDRWYAEKIETLARVLEDEPAVGIVFSNGRVVGSDDAALGFDLWESLAFDEAERAQVRAGQAIAVFLKHVVAAGTTMAFRGSFRELVLPFPALRSCHDAWLAFLIAAVSDVRIVEQPLIDYRLHGANQIGIQKHGLLGQLRKAREQLETDAFGYATRFFSEARERLAGPAARGLDVSPATLHGIDEKITHSRCRADMSGSLGRRLPEIVREALSGRYGRYSYGVRSIAQDLLLR